MYGKRWFREYGMNPTETWIAAIQRMSDESIKRALTNLAQSGGEHPPTLPAFVTAGSKSAGLGLDYTPEYYREPELAPAALIEMEPTEDEKEHSKVVRETAVAESLRLLSEGKKQRNKIYAEKRKEGVKI